MNALAISDLTPMAGEPRVRDMRLGEVLGLGRPTHVRLTIKKNEAELLRYGGLYSVNTNPGKAGGRPTSEYWLNEGQALAVCALSRTDRAADVREQLIRLCMAYRRGELTSAESVAAILSSMEARLAAMEALGGRLGHLIEQPRESALSLTHVAALWSGQKHQGRPYFWHDVEVRGLVLATYRQMTIDRAIAKIANQCGKDRTPSRTALARFWLRLDRLRHIEPSERVR